MKEEGLRKSGYCPRLPPGGGLVQGAGSAEVQQSVEEVSLAADCLCRGQMEVDPQKGHSHGKDVVAESCEAFYAMSRDALAEGIHGLIGYRNRVNRNRGLTPHQQVRITKWGGR
jgi:hypothetical protein